MVTDASGNVSFGGTSVMSSSFLRNRIINGNIAVDQRNAGATQTFIAAAALAYSVDRGTGTAQAQTLRALGLQGRQLINIGINLRVRRL